MHTHNLVIVYGVDSQIGLCIVRELGKKGCRVIAIGKSEDSIGLSSRYVYERHVIPNALTESEKVTRLNRINSQNQPINLLCISESDILFFNRVKSQLENIIPLVPSSVEMNKVLNKSVTIGAAERVGILTPKSISIDKLEDINSHLDSLEFPVVLKWSNPLAVIKEAAKAGIRIEKLLYIYNSNQLIETLKRYSILRHYPLIQEYISGYGLGQFFFMHDGECLLRFQHRRLHEWPPEGGYSSLCESTPLQQHSALQNQSIALLKTLNWSGVAMVEYRYDEAKNTAVLMEINGRFWGSYPLAYHSNALFAWYTYKILGLGESPESEPISPNIRCRNLLVELKRLNRIFFHSKLIQDKSIEFSRLKTLLSVTLGFFDFRMRYYLFSLDDLKPVISDMKNVLKKITLNFRS
ncbi:MAG: carboxylate--amine ligase [Cellvibrionaceae bacterium]|nr:carboxylate--amine ligase [Cellvibrionaceae bacterium]|tara:strand:+ start:21903 stop:23129 length:1227 start_codon:yes stop_codon:yes gene_type:complete